MNESAPKRPTKENIGGTDGNLHVRIFYLIYIQAPDPQIMNRA